MFHSYSVISDEQAGSLESRCAVSLTSRKYVSPHYLAVPSFDGMAPLGEGLETAWSKTHPVDNYILIQAMMSRIAAQNGHRVLLHGGSGDLATGHFPRYIASMLRSGRWLKAWSECQAASKNFTYFAGLGPLEILMLNLRAAFVPEALKRPVRLLSKRGCSSPRGIELLHP